MYEIKYLRYEDITSDMLTGFNHQEHIRQIYVKRNDNWEKQSVDEIHQWDTDKKIWITEYMREQIAKGGFTLGAFSHNRLAGFCCVDRELEGEEEHYANLTMLFVDDEFKRNGIGRALFQEACTGARRIGADKLFISSVPTVDTVKFYFSMGCVDAERIILSFIDSDDDRYMEYVL